MEGLAVPFQNIAEGINNFREDVTDFRLKIENILFGEEYSLLHMNDPDNFWYKQIHGTWVKEEKQELHESIAEQLKIKIPFLYATYDIFSSIMQGLTEEVKPPEFKISIPKYGINDVKIIDFTWYEPYRLFIKNIIKAIAWYFFIKRLLRRAPSLVY